jgi:amidase
VGVALDVVYGAAIAWIPGYWIRKLGREPGSDEIEPFTRAAWEQGRYISVVDYLLAI